jgi:hypothetical protein
MSSPDDQNSNKTLTDLLFGAFEKMAQAPGKIKGGAEPALDFVKTVRDEFQNRISEEIAQKLKTIDWDKLSRRAADHLAESYDIEVNATVRLKPKKKTNEEV